jgi:hypothetical protein
MAAEHPVDRAAIATDLERARTEFHHLLAEAERHDAWDTTTCGTHWTNEQLMFHMVFGYMIVQRLLLLLKLFSRLPDQVSRVFAGLLTAATKPFDVINYYGSCAAALIYNRRRMGAKMDRVIAALQRKLAREPPTTVRSRHAPSPPTGESPDHPHRAGTFAAVVALMNRRKCAVQKKGNGGIRMGWGN